MDPRRLLILAAAGLMLSGCAVFRGEAVAPVILAPAPWPAPASSLEPPPAPGTAEIDVAEPDDGARPYLAEIDEARPTAPALATGRAAIAAANAQASAPSRSDAFVGGMQVFAWSPGRVFEVWTAPLRVTTLTLAEGETLVAKAAGDTVRWQIGEASSGEGPSRRTHVMLKPLERGLETNLVLTTNRRVYLIDLRSGTPAEFNASVAWNAPGTDSQAERPESIREDREVRVPDAVVMPEGPLDARYRLEFRGRAPRWTPSAVFNDGRRTFIAFHPDLQVDEAPALFIIAPDGEAQLTNYRQAGGLFIVDRVIDRAELRLGDRRPQVVRIRRLVGAHP
ncbi:MAG: TrbG/VirB9 family P-type conjugative transfer protein [Caulobacterales bacterium]|nr:TrbG/VirB9 family P-type conjugative transfer protein [Caulobacterales bacterium]